MYYFINVFVCGYYHLFWRVPKINLEMIEIVCVCVSERDRETPTTECHVFKVVEEKERE